MGTALIDLIIMQITLVPDSLAPSWMGAIFSIWRKPAIFKFLIFYKMAVIF